MRNRGTLGGSLANSDPAADYPAAVLGARRHPAHRQRPPIAADAFFKGLFETALEPGELITAVDFPVPEPAAYVKFPQPASRFALVGVFVAQTSAARCGWRSPAPAPCVFRVKALEDALGKRFDPHASRCRVSLRRR